MADTKEGRIMKTAYLIAIAFLGVAGANAQNVRSGDTIVFEKPYWTETPVIEVLGRAEIELPPNRASFSVSFVETNKDAKIAMRSAVERARIAYDAVKAVAGDSARVTTSVQVDPYYEQYRDRDGDRIENRRADKVKGYEGRASVAVTMLDVSKAGEARAAALVLGPENSGNLRLYLERTAEINRQAYEAAVNDAAARARASARAASATLGRVLVIQEGQGPCLGRWTSQPGRTLSRNEFVSASPVTSANRRQSTVVVTGSLLANGREQEVIITQADIDALNLPSDKPPQTVTAKVCVLYAIGG